MRHCEREPTVVHGNSCHDGAVQVRMGMNRIQIAGRISVAVCGLVVGVAGCGSSEAGLIDRSAESFTTSTSTTVQQATSTTLASSTLPAVDVVAETGGSIGSMVRLGDESLPAWPSAPLVNWAVFQTANELASASSIVAVARLDGARPAVRTLALESTVEDSAGSSPIEYDGLVFTIEDVIVGTVADGDEIVVAVPAVAVDDGQTWRIPSDFLELLSSGLADQPGRHRYLVFANQREGWAPVYEFATPAGVTEIDANGILRAAWRDSPFAGKHMSVDDVRRAIEAGP